MVIKKYKTVKYRKHKGRKGRNGRMTRRRMNGGWRWSGIMGFGGNILEQFKRKIRAVPLLAQLLDNYRNTYRDQTGLEGQKQIIAQIDEICKYYENPGLVDGNVEFAQLVKFVNDGSDGSDRDFENFFGLSESESKKVEKLNFYKTLFKRLNRKSQPTPPPVINPIEKKKLSHRWWWELIAQFKSKIKDVQQLNALLNQYKATGHEDREDVNRERIINQVKHSISGTIVSLNGGFRFPEFVALQQFVKENYMGLSAVLKDTTTIDKHEFYSAVFSALTSVSVPAAAGDHEDGAAVSSVSEVSTVSSDAAAGDEKQDDAPPPLPYDAAVDAAAGVPGSAATFKPPPPTNPHPQDGAKAEAIKAKFDANEPLTASEYIFHFNNLNLFQNPNLSGGYLARKLSFRVKKRKTNKKINRNPSRKSSRK